MLEDDLNRHGMKPPRRSVWLDLGLSAHWVAKNILGDIAMVVRAMRQIGGGFSGGALPNAWPNGSLKINEISVALTDCGGNLQSEAGESSVLS